MNAPLDLVWRDLDASDTSERNYVLSSWIRTYAAGGLDARSYAEFSQFCSDYAPVVRSLVARSHVRVATLRETPSLMLGWAAVDGDTVHYLCTKRRWRRLGVARWMLCELGDRPAIRCYTHRTTDGARMRLPGSWSYRRWRVWPAEESAA